MNINQSTYSKNQSFGMAFERPNKRVLSYFQKAITELPLEERANFVKEVGEIVKGNANIPVKIQQEVNGALYSTSVGNNCYYIKNPKTKAQGILETMKASAKEAENIANINDNMNKINNLFDIKA